LGQEPTSIATVLTAKETEENIGHEPIFARRPVDGSLLEQNDENPRRHKFRADRRMRKVAVNMVLKSHWVKRSWLGFQANTARVEERLKSLHRRQGYYICACCCAKGS
jgi:hypothetical protein